MSDSDTIFIASDHAGFPLKKTLLEYLAKEMPSLRYEDLGPFDEMSVDYPDFAKSVAERVGNGKGRGILVCGSGIGMSIAANKIVGVRAAVVWDATSSRLSRQHNDANVLCLGARLTGPEVAMEIAKVWLSTAFQGGRHEKRILRIREIEKGK